MSYSREIDGGGELAEPPPIPEICVSLNPLAKTLYLRLKEVHVMIVRYCFQVRSKWKNLFDSISKRSWLFVKHLVEDLI